MKNHSHSSVIFRVSALVLLLAFLNLTVGCRNYFRVNKIKDLNAELTKENIYAQQKLEKYIMVHNEGKAYHLYNLRINQDNMTMEGMYSDASPVHELYIPNIKSSKRYETKAGQSVVLNEVHIVTSSITLNPQGNIFTIPLSAVSRIDIIEHDSGKTTASYVFGTVGIIFLIGIIIIIVILATKSSCPFVYISDGQSYIFKGEIYGGAIFKPLERDDYIPLTTINKRDSVFNIKITNELKERQFTNLANIIAAEHNAGERILIDSKGTLHSVSFLQPPAEAKLNLQTDYAKELSTVDSTYCFFNAEGGSHHVNELIMKFHKPPSAINAKLVLNAKNSLWLDFAFGELTKLFGIYYNKWIEKQRTEDAEKLNQWSEKQNLPLTVYIKEENNWKLVEHIPTIGPLATRDLCIPINLSNVHSDIVEIKLTCGFMFWELDYAAIDFTPDKSITSYILKPFEAIDETGKNVTVSLSETDSQYLVQPYPGCETTITYRLPELSPQKQYDVFLHARGYYEHVRDYSGLPDKKLLESFKQEGAFIDFSKQLYDELSGNLGFTVNKD
ncbi:MAG: hypothetical protein JJE25_11495 [Bacteroidia bacterium]|nr:hypothetical protein [Bacteroidia bacterium]